MERLGRSLQATAERIWRWFFPPEIELPEGLRQLLAFLYPRLESRGTHVHLGFPHLLKLIPNQGITLPATVRRGQARVYIHQDCWDPGSVRGLGLVVHEAYHVLQVQQAWRGWGLGLLHPFTVLYAVSATTATPWRPTPTAWPACRGACSRARSTPPPCRPSCSAGARRPGTRST